MAAKALGLPGPFLATCPIESIQLEPASLVRVSGHASGVPFFGTSGANRFDAPGWRTKSPEFGTCYFGLSLAVAVAESVLHDEIPVRGKFYIAASELTRRFVHGFVGDALNVLDLTGSILKRAGGSAELAGTMDYDTTQQWALAVHSNPMNYDGFVYVSRHHNTGRAVVLFERARGKLRSAVCTRLTATAGFDHVAKEFGILPI